MKKLLSFLLSLALLICWVPMKISAEEAEETGFQGKTISILGDSISTYTGVSNDATANSTLKGGAIYYNAGTLGVYQQDTWWQQAIEMLDLELLVNNSWSGSCVLKQRSGTVGAYIDRCVQLHNDLGEDPDLIAVYLGTNDFWTYPDTLGTADDIVYTSLISQTDEGFYYAEPTTTCEAYAIMLHKMMVRYPNAEIYCFTLLPRGNQTEAKVQLLQNFNASIKQIAAKFGVRTVDLYNDSGIKADQNFQSYVADNALHPGPAGMDAITGCFTSALLKNSRYSTGTVYDVCYDLSNVRLDQGTVSAMLGGSSFACSFTAPTGYVLNVTVEMGGEDVTSQYYGDGRLAIDEVTGDIQITAWAEQIPDEPNNFRWECREDQFVSVLDDGYTDNPLTMLQGSITDGKFANVKFTVSEAIVLKHDRPWSVEWKSQGTWSDTTDGALLFAGAANSTVAETPYLYRRHNSDFIAFGMASGGRYYNYGVSLSANGIDGTAMHTYRLTNRILEDGSNMVYLYVDDQEIGPMNHHWIGGTDQKTTVDWVSGRDFTFTNMGTSPHTIGNCSIEYIQVLENGHIHSYQATVTKPTCVEDGYTTYRCACSDSYVADYVSATGEHIYEEDICVICGSINPELAKNFRWEYREDQFVSVLDGEYTDNPLTMVQGSITDGKFANVKFTVSEAIVLKHDRPWSVEWKSRGSWSDTTDGALLFAGAANSTVAEIPYLYRRHNSDFIAFGMASGGRYYNYGVSLSANGIDGTVMHTYRLTNRILEDGTNMVYLYVDDQEVGPMNHHWIGGTDQKTTVDWVSGRDFTFTNMGTSPHTIGNCSIEYIQVWENGHTHSYEQIVTEPTCTESGYTTYTCACGNGYRTDETAPLNHSYHVTVTEPGCVIPGYTAHQCQRCDYSFYDHIVPAKGHEYESFVTEPTYTTFGYTTHICKHCSDSYEDQITYPIGHNYEIYVVEATCISDGYTAYVCTCGASYTTDEVPALGHSFANGICTVCGEADPDYLVMPTLTLKAPTLEFKDMITVNAMFTAENLDSVVEMGMITYTEKVDEWSVETANYVIPGTTYDASTGRYIAASQGIHAKYLGDTVYLACYAKLTDGSYVYTKLAGYSPVQYATSKLKGTDVPLKQLVVAMLNYGAAAQVHFNHNVDNLANATLTAEQIALPEAYRSDMVSTVASPDATKQGAFANNKGFAKRYPSISFEGAFCINYFFTPNYAPVDGITMYYWNAADYEAAEVLSISNASGSFKMEGSGTGEYRGDITGIAAKALSEATYVAAVYSDGTSTWTSGVLGYSIGAYCSSQSTKGGTIADLAMATAVYGYQAKVYFG